MSLPSLGDLIAALPEIYQPIYGHPEYEERAARRSDNRLTHILAAHDALAAQLGRPVRVLDLGCAQGWFDFHLAKAGAQVLGIDILAANINVCNMLALENSGLNVRFCLMDAEHLLEHIAEMPFDLVLGLSVLHHLCYHNGKEATRDFMRRLFEKIPTGIMEFAVAEEPVKWAPSLPANPDYLIDYLPFFRVLTRQSTHLSDVKRPLYFCSRQFWYLNGMAGAFDHWEESKEHKRRYFFSESLIIKLYQTVGEHGVANRNAITRTAKFLSSPPPAGYPPLPKMLCSGEAEGVVWGVQEKIEGIQLGGLMGKGQPYDARAILRQILGQLAALENAGLYHADLRVWNVIVSPDGTATLIDYNEISEISRDCMWPWSVFLSFFIFVREVVTGNVSYTQPARQPFISPYNLPEPYRSWSATLWSKPVDTWRFTDLLETFEHMPAIETGASDGIFAPVPDVSAIARWMASIEEYADLMVSDMRSLESSLRQVIEKMIDHTVKLQQRVHNIEVRLSGGGKDVK